MVWLNIPIAFIAGFFTFFAGCVAPILPIYLSYLTKIALDDKSDNNQASVLKTALYFLLGFIITFMLVGLSINGLVRHIASHQILIEKLTGILLIAFGISMLINRVPFAKKRLRIEVEGLPKNHLIASVALGALMNLAWTPCIGPVLGTILLWAGVQTTFAQAFILLLSFSLGLSLPFILIGAFYNKLHQHIKNMSAFTERLRQAAGILLIIFGLLMLMGKYNWLSAKTLDLFGNPTDTIELQQES